MEIKGLTPELAHLIIDLNRFEAGRLIQIILRKEFEDKKTKKTKEKGVSWSKESNKWRSRCVINGKDKHVGLYNSIEEAVIARCEFLKENNNG